MKAFISILVVLALAVGGFGYAVYADMVPGSNRVKEWVRSVSPDLQDMAEAGSEVEKPAQKGGGENTQGAQKTAYEIIESNPELSEFAAALEKTGLIDDIQTPGPLTIFAPTNTAFDNIPGPFAQVLGEEGNTAILKDLLSYHVIPGSILSRYLGEDEVGVAALGSRPVRLSKAEGNIVFNDIPAQQSDILVKNGVVHIVNSISLEPLRNPAVPNPGGPAQSTAPAPSDTLVDNQKE